MINGLFIYGEIFAHFLIYIRKPFLIYDFATAPLWSSLYMRKIWLSFLSVYDREYKGDDLPMIKSGIKNCTVPPGLTGTAQLWRGRGGRGGAYRILKLGWTGTHRVLRVFPSMAGLVCLLHDKISLLAETVPLLLGALHQCTSSIASQYACIFIFLSMALSLKCSRPFFTSQIEAAPFL